MTSPAKRQAKCWMTGTTFEVGDVVTRHGDDRQKIISIGEVGDMIEVECIKEPLGYLNEDGTRGEPWCKVGDREHNLTRRYSFPDDLLIEDYIPDGEAKAALARIRRSNYNNFYKDALVSLQDRPVTYRVKPMVPFDTTKLSPLLQMISEHLRQEAENAREEAGLAAMEGGAK